MTVQLKDILPRIMQKDDWRINLARRWDAVVGSLQTKIRLEKTYDSTAVIGVYEAHWMQELYLLTDELCDAINNVIGQQKITHIRFLLVEERERTQKKTEKRELIIPTKVPLSSQQQQALTKITDPALQQAMQDFWFRCSALQEMS